MRHEGEVPKGGSEGKGTLAGGERAVIVAHGPQRVGHVDGDASQASLVAEGGRRNRWHRGRRGGSTPDQHGPIFINSEQLALNEFGLQVLKIVVIQVELALERAIRQAPSALQQGHGLVEEFLKGHR
jgi:hypothetical protein